ncbi:acetyl-CoA hydrolase/transferase C-terminal domain-containing protein [Roseateles sp. DB2]|uniref:acetyl-CoA hydrolase/transferase C-terminal domain-containing protein n=1 Tax=Roseateles sp. DB2 TaxID=3453717 RepID=UPI003EE8FF75
MTSPLSPHLASTAPLVQDLERAVDLILERVPGDIVMAIPLGLGKPNPLVNALYRRVSHLPERRLKIFTALSLEKPVGKSELEQQFLGPLVERVFADYPDLDYVKDHRAQALPPNIEVHEFFLKTGDYLGNPLAQQGFVCTNYSFVVRDMMSHGVNLILQAVACRGDEADAGGRQLSLSCNPDLSLDLIERLAAQGRKPLTVLMINRQLPFMTGPAVVPAGLADLLVETPATSHQLFAPPNAAIGWADYAIGLHAASLVKDGGTLQIGIGSLGDAIAQALIVRQTRPAAFRQMLAGLALEGIATRELAPFEQGLYGCSEMFVNGLLQLIRAGIVKRRVFQDEALQTLALEGALSETPSVGTLLALQTLGALPLPLDAPALRHWQSQGLLSETLTLEAARTLPTELGSSETLQAWSAVLGTSWRQTALLHGGFFLGPRDFYQTLRELDEPLREQIAMTRIGYINELYGDALGSERLKRLQRRDARFMNTTMKMTLLGAAGSDALESGQVVSGVGGQYNFVAMGHALPDARSILMLRATHDNHHGLTSSIVWNYGNVTIPRHLRDIVITEYGVADLRGRTDTEVVQALIRIADSRFQDELVREAQAHGKLAADWQLPDAWRCNRPEALRELLRPWRNEGLLPDFPFGTDLTEDELKIVRALKKLKHASTHPVELVGLVLRSLQGLPEVPEAYLERLGLDQAHSFKQLFLKRLFAANL